MLSFLLRARLGGITLASRPQPALKSRHFGFLASISATFSARVKCFSFFSREIAATM